MSAAMTKLKTGKITDKNRSGHESTENETDISFGSSGPIIEQVRTNVWTLQKAEFTPFPEEYIV